MACQCPKDACSQRIHDDPCALKSSQRKGKWRTAEGPKHAATIACPSPSCPGQAGTPCRFGPGTVREGRARASFHDARVEAAFDALQQES